MDLIDKKILCELDFNCRLPISKIAKKLRVNRNVVNYRIKSLEKQKIITNYICSINLGLLGYKTYKIFFKIHSKKQLEESFVQELLKNHSVLHLIKTEGSFDYSSTIAVKNIKELDDFLIELKTKFKDLIKDYEVSIVVYSRIFKLDKLLLGKKQAVKFEKYSGEEEKIKLDEKDKKILKQLSQSANLSIIELSEKTNLSLDVVKYRLKQLTEKIVNSYRVMLNLNKLGYYHYVIMLRMKQAAKEDEERLVNWCSIRKNVLFCTKRIGFSDFEINAAITDINDLNSFLKELKSEFGDFIDSYELIINSNLLKLNYVP